MIVFITQFRLSLMDNGKRCVRIQYHQYTFGDFMGFIGVHKNNNNIAIFD